jgi:hypothetical protein
MKISQIRLQERGTTLLATLLIAGIFATVLGTYLSMTTQENLIVKRSIGWNSALPLAEAGIEEACSHVNKSTNAYIGDGWTLSTNTFAYNKTRFLGDGYYSVDINGWMGGVVAITSTGYGHWRGGSNYISRTVQITAQTPTPYFPSGLIANTIDIQGNFSADSFDSRTNLYSTNGQYDPKKATDHALIASSSSSGYSLGGSSTVNGYVASAGGLVTGSGATSVGDFSWTKNNKGFQTGHYTNGFNANFPPVMAPYGPNQPGVKVPTIGTNAAIAYDYMLSGGFYYASNLLASQFGKTMFVAKDSVLVVTGDVNLAQITFNPTNAAKLSLFLGYPSITFQAALINGSSPQFWLYGLPSCTYMKMTGSAFMGVIYAPGVYLDAEGNQGTSIQGAIVADRFHCQGGFNFHQDQATGGTDAKPFKILSWAEL